MSNMSYCRFHNTLGDLRDCDENFESIDSEEEREKAIQLVELCREIAERYPADEDLHEMITCTEEEEENYLFEPVEKTIKRIKDDTDTRYDDVQDEDGE